MIGRGIQICGGSGSRAFTLVELLVVVSIVGLLISILMPALGSARERARRTTCKVHLRQLVIASEAYAIDHKALPIMNRQGFDINYRSVDGSYVRQDVSGFAPDTWDTYLHPKNFWTGSRFRGLIFQVDIKTGMTETDFGLWRNFGLLWTGRAFGDPRGMFCPSQKEPFFAWGTPYNPWPPRLETARRPDNDRYANHTASGFERRLGLTGVQWDRVDPKTALYTDRLLDHEDENNVVPATHGDGINLAYRDGHVRYLSDKRIYEWQWNEYVQILELYDWLDRQFNR